MLILLIFLLSDYDLKYKLNVSFETRERGCNVFLKVAVKVCLPACY